MNASFKRQGKRWVKFCCNLYPTGIAAHNIEAFSMLSSSNSIYVGEITFNSEQLYGNWTITFQSLAFTLDVTATRLMYVQETLYQLDNSNSYGFSTIEGRPLEGKI